MMTPVLHYQYTSNCTYNDTSIPFLVQATHRQMWMVMNFVLTVIGSFVFGYFAAYFAGIESTWVR